MQPALPPRKAFSALLLAAPMLSTFQQTVEAPRCDTIAPGFVAPGQRKADSCSPRREERHRCVPLTGRLEGSGKAMQKGAKPQFTTVEDDSKPVLQDNLFLSGFRSKSHTPSASHPLLSPSHSHGRGVQTLRVDLTNGFRPDM